MQRRQGWLFPIMVVAATSVIAFGAVGIAAITGHLVMPPEAPAPLDQAAGSHNPLMTANAHAQERVAQSAGATLDAAAPAHAARLPADEHGQPLVPN
jgi:hypothetical protein